MYKNITFYVDRADPSSMDVDAYLLEDEARETALNRRLHYFYRHEQHFVDEQLVHSSWERVDV